MRAERVRPGDEPIIISVSGEAVIADTVLSAIRSGDIETEGAFARFSSLCRALAPGLDEDEAFQAQEGFWCLDGSAAPQRLRGELAWFQIEHLGAVPPVRLLPLFFHAAIDTVGQLGSSAVSALRVQTPSIRTAFDPVWVQALLDQFAAVAEVTTPVRVRARLHTGASVESWSTEGRNWFARTHTGDISVTGVTAGRHVEEFDNRWSLRTVQNRAQADFTVPEWSAAGASTAVVLMLEAARASGISGPVIVDVEAAEDEGSDQRGSARAL